MNLVLELVYIIQENFRAQCDIQNVEICAVSVGAIIELHPFPLDVYMSSLE